MTAFEPTGSEAFGKSQTSTYSGECGSSRRTVIPIGLYVECVENFSDIRQLTDAHERGWLNAREFMLLNELGRKLSNHTAPTGNDYDYASILADPAWQSVAADAEHARLELAVGVVEASERKVLLAGE